MYSTLINSYIALISLATATGILLHDTRIDKAASVATLPLAHLSSETGAKLVHTNPNDFHTHIERTQVGHTLSALQAAAPGIAPRAEDKKHLLQRYVGKGHHAFDNYNLPLI